MSTAALTAVGAIAAALAAVFGALIGRRASPYSELARRVVELEKQRGEDLAVISDLRRSVDVVIDDRDALVRYISVFREWVAAGAKPPAPTVPQHLRDILPD